jgi:hypothetical protein
MTPEQYANEFVELHKTSMPMFLPAETVRMDWFKAALALAFIEGGKEVAHQLGVQWSLEEREKVEGERKKPY